MSALSSWTIDKYEYLTGEEILHPDQKRAMEQAKFTHSSLGKAFEKQTKTKRLVVLTNKVDDHKDNYK